MAMSIIRSFICGNRHVTQSIDTSTDAVYFSTYEKDIFHINSMGYCTNGYDPQYLGKFYLIKNVWVFCFFNDNFVSVNNCDKITTPMYDLIGAEMYVVLKLIKQNVLEV